MGIGEQYEFEKTGRILPESEMVVMNDAKIGKREICHFGGNPIHKEFYDLITQIVNTFERKNHDYAGSDTTDMMQNFMRCENYGIKMSDGIVTRISDKITRMENLMRTRSQKVTDESLIDTVMDLANYSILLAIALKREGK